MEKNKNGDSFQYTYSAGEQEELKKICSKYMPKEENKMELLRRLDAKVTRKATAFALNAGVGGTLMFGAGMSCCLVQGGGWFVPGIALGLAGLGVLGLAYPIYSKTLQKERKRVAPEIMRLMNELMK